MGPIAYPLCQKALIGPLMWITGLCAFPALVSPVSLPLSSGGETVSASFTAPVDKRYQFVLRFDFESTEARLNDEIVGKRQYRPECDDGSNSLVGNPEYGRPIPIRVVIRAAKDRSVVVDKQFTSLCAMGHVDASRTRSVGWVTLLSGDYTMEATNVEPQAGLTNVRTFIYLVSGGGK